MGLPTIACCAAPTWQPLQLQEGAWAPPWDVLVISVNEQWPDDAQVVASDLRAGWECVACGALYFEPTPSA